MGPFDSIKWPNGRLGVAFSAGKDSTALLTLAKQVYPKNNLVALHINHNARTSKSCEAECHHADEIAASIEVPLYRVTLDNNLNSEAEWREARYLSLAQLGIEHNLDTIATAHHSQDQSETILLNLLRGTDLSGLKGMPEYWERHRQKFCRPLLNIDPEDLYHFLDSNNLKAFEDPSNSEKLFKRNQLRHEILPLLEDFQPGCLKRIAQLGASIQKNISWQKVEYQKQTKEITAIELSNNEVAYDRLSLKQLPEPILDLWCHEKLCMFADGASKVSRQHIDSLNQFILSDTTGYLDRVLPGQVQVRGQKKKIIFKQLS